MLLPAPASARSDAPKPRLPREPRDPGPLREPRRQRSERKQPTPVAASAEQAQAVPPLVAAGTETPAEETGSPPRRRGRRGGRRERPERTESPVAFENITSAATMAAASSSEAERSAVEPLEAVVTAPVAADAAQSVTAIPPTCVEDVATLAVAGVEQLAEVVAVADALSEPAAPAEADVPLVALDAAVPMPVTVPQPPLVELPSSVPEPVSVEVTTSDLSPATQASESDEPLPASGLARSIQAAVEEGGLIMVETTRDDTRALPPERHAVVPRPRRRRPAVVIPDEPLVMVETRK